MMRFLFAAAGLLMAIFAVHLTSTPALGQVFFAGVGDWNTNANWDTGFVPDIQFGEAATINNGASVAQVGSNSTPTIAQLSIGPGAVEISGSGLLKVEPDSAGGGGNGNATVNGTGRLSVASGGAFNATRIITNGTLEVSGPNAMVTAGAGILPSLVLSASSTLSVQLSDASFNPIATGGSANLGGGTLNVDFGFTPGPADTWDLVDALAINGNFSAVNVSGGISLQPWQSYAVRTSGGGTNGTVATLQLEDRLVLSIDRATGVGAINNMAGSAIDLDGYTVQSALGAIGTAGFNSFADQNLDGGAWDEFGVLSPTAIGELRENGVTSLAPAGSRAVGAIFDPNVTELGVDYEDLSFSYTNANGDNFEGLVMFEGNKKFNNLVLNVDPDTGEAVLVNESPLTYTFDGYAVKSASGSLLPGGWNSLDDQDAAGGDWLEIGSNSNQIGELKRVGETTLNQNTSFNLGAIFNTAGTPDLELEFIFGGDVLTPRAGVVSYEPITGGVPGDYNNDGRVDAADYTVWRNGLGTSFTAADYEIWVNNYGVGVGAGTGSGSSAGAVPEPVSGMLLAGCLGLLLLNAAGQRLKR